MIYIFCTFCVQFMHMPHLSSKEREFLGLIYQAAFANPFGSERESADMQISGLAVSEPKHVRLASVTGKTQSFLKNLKVAATDLPKEDRELLEKAHLFNIFHRYTHDFDLLIQTQKKSPAETCKVTFASSALSDLSGAGFSSEISLRYFAAFYQLRRAYFFINENLTGKSDSMRRLRRSLWNNVFTCDMSLYVNSMWNRMEDFSTLILGETGTGKGSSASAIGRSGFIPFNPGTESFSESFMESFTSINLSQFPASLVESELFGHRKGAFTGAVEAHQGIFSRCSRHGAIFLDEIGDVPQPIQIKLLQILQERHFTPVGSHESKRFSGRVIAATNKDIEKLRAEETFRDDFYYRLCSDIIKVPPLRERLLEYPEELDDLIRHCLCLILGLPEKDTQLQALSQRIRTVMGIKLGPDYSWPGNVRELEQHVRSILLTGTCEPSDSVTADDVASQLHHGIDKSSYSADALLSDYCKLLYDRFGTYEEVARHTDLDRRTAKKYIQM